MKKNQNVIKEPSFGTPRGVMTCLLTLSLRTTPIGVFSDYFSFSHFWPLTIAFKTKELLNDQKSLLNSALNFT